MNELKKCLNYCVSVYAAQPRLSVKSTWHPCSCAQSKNKEYIFAWSHITFLYFLFLFL